MLEKDLLRLQNGSDVRGIALEGVPDETVNLRGEEASVIAGAFVHFLAQRLNKKPAELKIAVGHDSRLSANTLLQASLAGIQSQGATSIDCGLASTPAMFMSIALPEIHMDGSIMITASHLPFNRNGLKFFTAEGGLEKADITQLLTTAATLEPQLTSPQPADKLALIDTYASHLCQKIREGLGVDSTAQPFQGMHIVVDAGNGAGGFFVDKVLQPLGANTEGSLYLEPDGNFPNHIPNPENQKAMDAIKGAVLNNQAHLGIIFDTDVDRMSAVLPDGQQISRNTLIAMMAAILAPNYPHSTIITDSVTSDELTTFLEGTLHLKHHRFMRGYKNVINECRRLNAAGEISPLAIETSGHGALSENYYLDDGAYLAVKLLIAAAQAQQKGQALADLIKELGHPAEEAEYRFYIRGLEDFKTYGNQVLASFQERAQAKGIAIASPSYEGVRLIIPNLGWILLRMSLHDPNMPMNMESSQVGGCQQLVALAKELTAGFEHLDTSVLK